MSRSAKIGALGSRRIMLWNPKSGSCYKKRTGKPSISYADTVEECLCFGWIDSLVKKVDDETYVQKFTPRKTNSRWSTLNKRRARRLIKLGRMTQAGLEKILEAKKNGSWHELDPIHELRRIPHDLAQALAVSREARKNFRKMTPTCKKQFLWWIETAKREETRKTRIEKTVKLVSQNRTMSDYYYGR
jgi:uncharacterized protein YdeI (YjbR/CyaY-like superfamily)